MNMINGCGRTPTAPEQRSVPREAYMLGYQIERDDAIDLILFYAHQGMQRHAWNDVRHEIQKHFEDRPRNSRGNPNAETEWLADLHELLALRRSIPGIVAKALRRMPSYERESRAAFNQVFNGEAR